MRRCPGFLREFIREIGSMMIQEVELKYCERCGTLGLRRRASGQIYCTGCAREMARVFLAPSDLRCPSPEQKKPCGWAVAADGGAR